MFDYFKMKIVEIIKKSAKAWVTNKVRLSSYLFLIYLHIIPDRDNMRSDKIIKGILINITNTRT